MRAFKPAASEVNIPSPTLGRPALLDSPFDTWPTLLGLGAKDAYRAKQVQEWVFSKRAKTFAAMTTLPQALREKGDREFTLRGLTFTRQDVSAQDGTQRIFFTAVDGKPVSCVFLPSKNDDDERFSLCVSTQVGCAWGCVFCASGLVPHERNLTPSEIVEQIIQTEEITGEKVSGVLFMGMGEPLANYTNVLAALRLIRSPLGLNRGARHVTVSTSGLVPQMEKMAKEFPKVNLAVSLHAADDETRKKILPKSSAWSIKSLLKATWAVQKAFGHVRVTFEYILLKGINDSERSAQRLSNMLRDKPAWVNLIAYNPVPGLPYEKPSGDSVHQFAKVLTERGVFVRVRRPQGVDIAAGCGQLGAPRVLGTKI